MIALGTVVKIGGEEWEVGAVMSGGGERQYALVNKDDQAHVSLWPEYVLRQMMQAAEAQK